MDSRSIAGRSGWPGSLSQRARATLNTAIPVSAARFAAGSGIPRSRSAPDMAAASSASLISSRSRSSGFADMIVSRNLAGPGFSWNRRAVAWSAAPTASMAVAEAGASAMARTRSSRSPSVP
jgi:hypothetical protein